MNAAYVTQDLPASGKRYKRVNKNDLHAMLDNGKCAIHTLVNKKDALVLNAM
jgi:hypothetical protein